MLQTIYGCYICTSYWKQRWKPDLAREENNPGKANLFLKSGKAQVASSERQIHRQADGTVLKGGFDKMERKKRFSIKKFQIEVKGSQGCEGSKAAMAAVAAKAAKNDLIQFFPAQPAASSRKKAKAKTVGGSQNVKFSL